MKTNRSIKDVIIVGFALFAMFFGSGNLIFPPYLGRLVGEEYPIGMIGFMIMGVGLPLLGVMAAAKVGGNFERASDKVGKVFSVMIMASLILAIGPFLAIPRTAATTYEIAVRPFIPQISPILVICSYFALNLFFALSPNSIVDIIGKYLTPILLVTLITLIVKGIFFPVGTIVQGTLANVFASSLIEGYQTMDVLAGVCFGGIIVNTIKEKGYKSSKEIIKITLKSSLVAILGLGTVYGGLMYLGAHTSHISGEMEKTALVIELAKQILGNAGTVFLAVAVGVACLTTSIGLTATGASYFSKLSKGKLSYKLVAIMITVISIGIATLGVDNIIGITTPILKVLYPPIIVLVLMTLMGTIADAPLIYKGTVYVTLAVVLVDVLGHTFQIQFLQKLIAYMPLSSFGFPWVVPTILTFGVCKVITGK